MNLQELLKKATKRPWWLEGHHLMGAFEQATPKSAQSKLIASMDRGHETAKFDAILQRHAVNNFEPMLDALTVAGAILASLNGKVSRETWNALYDDSHAIREAIRQAEKVET